MHRPLTLHRRKSDRAKPEDRSGRVSDTWLKLAQITAILAAGIWTLTMYFSHVRTEKALENENKRLTNDQIRLNLYQQRVLASVESDRSRTLLATQKFELDMKKAMAETEKTQKLLGIEQQRIALSQGRLASAIMEQDRQLKGLELQTLKQTPLQFEFKLTPVPSQTAPTSAVKRVKLAVHVKNISRNRIKIHQG